MEDIVVDNPWKGTMSDDTAEVSAYGIGFSNSGRKIHS
jgi:hypothetical protein